MDEFEGSPWVVNTALRFIFGFVNDAILGNMTADLQNFTQGVFSFKDTVLGYDDGYIVFGFSIIIPNLTQSLLREAGTQYIVDYLDRQISERDEEFPGFPPVEPHLIAMMQETERQYQELISNNQTLYEAEKLKHQAVLKKYPLLATNGRKDDTF